ncbi:MAG: c-type cytochrome [Deltaproteobacteria bacterium]|nr:c-type cytochrome [Deltaproteobacteria bacterium]
MRLRSIAPILLVVVAAAAASACRAPAGRPAGTRARAHPAVARQAAEIARGEVAYAAYCASCHGARRDGRGALAAALDLRPTDLRAPALWAARDDALVARLARGTPLPVPGGAAAPELERDAGAVAAYVAGLGRADWNLLRAGRVVYEESCAACHGPYGRAEGAIARWLGAPDLLVVRERVSDRSLARIADAGIRAMPPLRGGFDAVERRALVAYVRHLSDGFRVYDGYCADCHGDDGEGAYTDELVPPASPAPTIAGRYPRAVLLHMLERGRGIMPHFRDILDEARLRDVVAYLRAAAGPP